MVAFINAIDVVFGLPKLCVVACRGFTHFFSSLFSKYGFVKRKGQRHNNIYRCVLYFVVACFVFTEFLVARPVRTLDLSKTGSIARGVSVDPTGKYAVVIGGASTRKLTAVDILVYNVGLTQKIKSIRLNNVYTNEAVFSPNGKFLAAALKSKGKIRKHSIVIWHFPSMRRFKTIRVKVWPWRVALTKKNIIYSTWGDKIIVLDRRTLKMKLDFSRVYGEDKFSINSKGSHMFVPLKSAEVVSLQTGKLRHSLPNTDTIWSTSISKSYYAAGHKKGLSVWSVKTGKLIVEKKIEAKHIRQLVFSGDESRLIAGDDKGHIFIYNTKTWEQTLKLSDTDGKITGIASIPRTNKFIVSGWDGRVHIYDLSSGSNGVKTTPVKIFYSMNSNAPFALSPSGKNIVFSWSIDSNTALLFRSLKTGKLNHVVLDSKYRLTTMSFVGEDKVLAVTLDGVLYVVDSDNHKWKHKAKLPTRGTHTIINENDIVQLSPSGKVYVLNHKGEVLRSFETGFKNASLASSSDSKTIVLWHSNGSIQVHDSTHGKLLYKKRFSRIRSLAISPNGHRLALSLPKSSRRGQLSIFDLPSGKKIISHNFPLSDKNYFSRTLRWSPDSKKLAVGHWHSVLLYDHKGTRRSTRLDGIFGYINTLGFTQNGNYLLGKNVDKYLYLWKIKK